MDRSEELFRELEVLRSKIQTLSIAQRRIEREAMHLAEAIGRERHATRCSKPADPRFMINRSGA